MARTEAPGTGRVRLRKRSGGNWYARFRDGDTRHEINLSVTNKVVAEGKAAQINAAMEKGEPWEWLVGRVRPGERTFRELVDDYLDRGSRWSENTRAKNTPTLGRLVEAFGDLPLSKLDRPAVEGYLARRKAEGLAKATRNRYLCALRVVLAKGVEWGYLRASPAADLKQDSEGSKKPRPYREHEVAALLEALPEEPRQVAELFLLTAMRRGELERLLWADVDLLGAELTVRGPKNGHDRTLPLNDRAVQILTERRRQWETEKAQGHADPFVYGSRANITKAVRRAWHVLDPERRDGLRPVHSLRDTSITRLAAAGVPLRDVQELAGHQTLAMTARYAGVTAESKRAAVTRAFG